MNDPATAELIGLLPHTAGPCLWIADENHHAILAQLGPHAAKLRLLSNRFDLVEQARALGINSQFNDWDFGSAAYSAIFLRICKEKPVNRHLLQQAFSHLAPEGRLWLCGQKAEGIKSVWQEATELFGQRSPLEKRGSAYLAQLDKMSDESPLLEPVYQKMQPIGEWNQRSLYSKPGVYGWNKIDQGSALLIAQLPKILVNPTQPRRILDLGCGYGFLTVASDFVNSQRRVATDNNAAALICTERNAQVHGLSVEVIAGDCADTVEGNFDLVLCNPPFHRGFDVDNELTRHFLSAARKKLDRGGVAVFVVNSFIPIEKKLGGLFRKVQTLLNDRQFKVLALEI